MNVEKHLCVCTFFFFFFLVSSDLDQENIIFYVIVSTRNSNLEDSTKTNKQTKQNKKTQLLAH